MSLTMPSSSPGIPDNSNDDPWAGEFDKAPSDIPIRWGMKPITSNSSELKPNLSPVVNALIDELDLNLQVDLVGEQLEAWNNFKARIGYAERK